MKNTFYAVSFTISSERYFLQGSIRNYRNVTSPRQATKLSHRDAVRIAQKLHGIVWHVDLDREVAQQMYPPSVASFRFSHLS